VRPDPRNTTGIVEFNHHCIADPEASHPRFADRNTGLPVADEFLPAQAA